MGHCKDCKWWTGGIYRPELHIGCVNFQAKEDRPGPYTVGEVYSTNEIATPGAAVSRRPDEGELVNYMKRFN